VANYHYKKKHLPTIRSVCDDIWNEVNHILPKEKPDNIEERPLAPFRQALGASVCTSNRLLSMEDAAKRIWFWLRMSPQ
jgi:hypothetical protein